MTVNSDEWQRISPQEQEIIGKYLEEVPVRLGAMAKKLGVSVKLSSELANNISGSIQKTQKDDYKITINKFEYFQRQRFTLAHELAHFLLHKHLLAAPGDSIKDNILYRSGAPEAEEYQANRLAAELIMPAESLRRRYAELQNEGITGEVILERLADEFKVSQSAIQIRLETVL